MWIQTFTGRQFFPIRPRPGDVCIEDVAHALALKCRFTGHCARFYSVAEHSVRCVQFLGEAVAGRHGLMSPALAMAALLHDAAEAYLPDVARPIKDRFVVAAGDPESIECEDFDAVEGTLLRAIFEGLGLPSAWITLGEATVKYADETLLATEARDLLGPPPAPWCELPPPMREAISPWRWEIAERQFREMFERLWIGIRRDAKAGVTPDFDPLRMGGRTGSAAVDRRS